MALNSNKKANNPDCPCAWPGCERHGSCEACKEYHHSAGEKTACEKQGKDRK